MSSTKLRYAPLKEVIFELHWECASDQFGMLTDTGFDLAQGKFAEKLKHDLPVHKKLVPDGIPFKVFGSPFHQYWKGEFQWPVVQHGQGMIAVNEVEQGYEWESHFKPLVISCIDRVSGSYDDVLRFNRLKLQYIDAWDLDETTPVDFVEQNLQTQIITNYPLPGKLKNFNLLQNFDLEDGSVMQLNISNGMNNQNQKKTILCTITVEKQDRLDAEGIVKWLEFAHSTTSNMFKQMLNPKFYASLD